MELIKDTPFEVAWQVWQSRPGRSCLTVVIKGSFDLVERGDCPISASQELPTGDAHIDEDTEASVRTESDFAPIKPQGECYVVGSCYQPGGRPGTIALVAFTIGSVMKKMAVVGDRHFQGLISKQTDPEPFTVMPLCWERSFGGAKSPTNPVGLGMEKVLRAGKKVVPLPNIENPDELIRTRRQRPAPIGSFPIPRSWRQRMGLAGSYDAKWLAKRWPGLPDDFDWSYHNGAPPDQRIEGYFRGDETITLLNLHPDSSKVSCKLPGLRVAAFLRAGDKGHLRSLGPELDTITVDTEAKQVFCLWRAVLDLGATTLDGSETLFVVHEPRGARQGIEHYRQWLERREEELAAEERELEAVEIRERPPLPAGVVEPVVMPPLEASTEDADVADASPPRSGEARPEPPRAGRMSERSTALPVPIPVDSPVLAAEMAAAEEEERQEIDVDLEATLDAFITGTMTEQVDMRMIMKLAEEEKRARSEPLPFQDQLVEASAELATFEEEATELIDPETFAAFLDEVEERKSADGADRPMTLVLEELRLPPLPDASEVGVAEELTEPPRVGVAVDEGADAAEIDAPGWAGEQGQGVAEAPRVPAVSTPPESPGSAAPEFTAEQLAMRKRVLAALASGEGCEGWDLVDAVLRGLDLSGGNFRRARLLRADLRGATLDGANLDEAELGSADLGEASFRRTTLREAELSGARASGASFEEASLDDVTGSGIALRRASLLRCTLNGADLSGADVSSAHCVGTVFDGADLSDACLDGSRFEGCRLVETDLSGSTSAQAVVMDGCDLTGLRASDGVDFRRGSFVEATIDGGRFGQARLAGCRFTSARLAGADFSEADLAGAALQQCVLVGSRFDGASLKDTVLAKSDLREARFEGAVLLRTDLRSCNLYGAEFLDAKLAGAQLELANLEGTKLA